MKTYKYTSPEGNAYKIFEDPFSKKVSGPDYKYIFSKINGSFMRWGAEPENDPQWSPLGPEILDIEITDLCRGIRDGSGHRAPCAFCYKSNGPGGKNHMTLETFKGILAKFFMTEYVVTLEDGTVRKFVSNELVTLSDGTQKAVSDLAPNDDLL